MEGILRTNNHKQGALFHTHSTAMFSVQAHQHQPKMIFPCTVGFPFMFSFLFIIDLLNKNFSNPSNRGITSMRISQSLRDLW